MAVVTPPRATPRARPGANPTPEELRARAAVRRRRNLPLAGIAALLIVGSGLVSVTLWVNAGHRQLVLSVRRAVPAGAVIQTADIGQVRVASDPGLKPIPATDWRSVTDHVAAVALTPGTLLTRAQITSGPVLAPGQTVVAIPLKAGQAPNLRAGDQVMVLVTASAAGLVTGESAPVGGGQDARGAVLVRSAHVYAVTPTRSADNVVVSVAVNTADAPALAGAANVGEANLSLIPTA